jgi:hypothetical protein
MKKGLPRGMEVEIGLNRLGRLLKPMVLYNFLTIP